MEYVDGPTVADLVDARGPVRPRDVARLGAQLLPPLLALHRVGLAHLDVKPENVLIRDGRPVLVDCGSARRLGSGQPAGHPVGTPGYAAPEMELCLPIAAGMDLFGLGAVLAEMLTGTPYPDGAELPAGRLADLVAAMLVTESAQRPTAEETLRGLAAAAGAGRLWPAWLDGGGR